MVRYEVQCGEVEARQLDGFFVGWPAPPRAEDLLALLQRAPFVVLARDGDPVVGFTYAISDGVLAAYIPLLEVRPEHQGRGIGTELIRRLLDQLGDHYMVDVVCDEEAAPFYERLGTTRLAGMAWRNREAPVLRVASKGRGS